MASAALESCTGREWVGIPTRLHLFVAPPTPCSLCIHYCSLPLVSLGLIGPRDMEQVRRDGGFPAESATAMGTDSSSLAIALPERKSLAITKEASNGEGKSKQGNNYTTDAPAGSSLEGARFYIMLGTTTLAVLLVALNATIIGTVSISLLFLILPISVYTCSQCSRRRLRLHLSSIQLRM